MRFTKEVVPQGTKIVDFTKEVTPVETKETKTVNLTVSNSNTRTSKNPEVKSGYMLYFRRAGEKVSVFCNTERELNEKRTQLKVNRRKYLGHRKVTMSVI